MSTQLRLPKVKEVMCGGKKAFTSRDRAKAAKHTIGRPADRMHPYLCPVCHKWHLGHHDGWEEWGK